MAEGGKKPDDVRVEQAMGNLLRAGVLLAAIVTAAGGVVYLAKRWDERGPPYATFPMPDRPTQLNSVLGVLRFAIGGRGQGLIQLGVLLLIATPVARVAFSVYVFLRQRDRLYVVVTLVVLALLLFSLFGGGWLPGG
jgi:uncharacterized membrane protein